MKTLLAVDGNSILNRAYYGIRALTNREGFPTNAIYGMVNMILKQMDVLQPDGLAVAFDVHAPTFRHKLYGEYKAGRRPTPEDLLRQFPVAKDCLRALGFCVLECEGYEADDILGTLSGFSSDACDVYLLTGDRDALQLIGDHTRVLLATNTETIVMDRTAFREKYGVDPSQYVDVKALMGDASDHIPGVPGIGEKSAFPMIAEYGSLDALYERLPNAEMTASVKAKLESGRESAYLSRRLAQIDRQVPLGLSASDLETAGIDRDAARELFVRLEFTGFLKRFALDAPIEAVHQAVAVRDVPVSQLPDVPTVAFTIDEENRLILTDGQQVFRCQMSGEVTSYLAARTTVTWDCKSLYEREWAQGMPLSPVNHDVMLSAYVIRSDEGKYDTERLVTSYLGEVYSEEVPAVVYWLRLYPVLEEKLQESGQSALLHEIEMPLAEVLADMERVGFCVDTEGIAAFGRELENTAKELEERIFFYAGGAFTINSPKQLGEILFERLGLPAGKKTKTGYSTNAEILEKLRPVHPIIQDILDYRQVTKLKSTYADGLCKVADAEGRVHTRFKQTGTATGRLSSAEPNLQNIPIRTELGRRFRQYFRAKDAEHVLIDADYSQIELRLLAAISGDRNMTQAFLSGRDIHTATAATVFRVDADAVTPEMRKKAKAVNFGIMYGIGDFSLADDLGISRVQARQYIDDYLAGYPGIDAYLHGVIREGYEKGYVSTLFARRRYIPELSMQNKMQQKFGERVAMNSPIQGTAADLIKIAMIRVYQALREEKLDARLVMQVHDELIVEASRKDADRALAILKREMEHVTALGVPLSVEIASGDTWLDTH